jgi:hypothetical protein
MLALQSTPVHTRWSHEFLDSMRQVMDPETDRLAEIIFTRYAGGGPHALARATALLEDWEAPIPAELPAEVRDFFARPVDYPAFVDPRQVAVAEDLFQAYGPISTVTLLLTAVPHFFTNAAGARSFYLARIFSPESLRNRMLEISQFIVNMTERGGLAQMWLSERQQATLGCPFPIVKGRGVITVQKLRLIHSNIRIMLRMAPPESARGWNTQVLGAPINQEDLAQSVLCFCFCTIDGLAKLGLAQTAEEEAATFTAWRVVGHLLGMREELQPATVAEGRALLALLMQRHLRKTHEGVVMTSEMLGITRKLLPWGLRSIPAALMRYLVGEQVADALDVPNPRAVSWLLKATQPIWHERRVFAMLARATSPTIVRWLCTREAGRGHPLLPDELCKEYGAVRD